MPAALATFLRAIAIWLLIMAAESAQGVMRRLLLSDQTEHALRQLSVGLGAVAIFIVTWLCMPWMRVRSTGAARTIGLVWVALTVCFEIGLGRLTGAGWDRIFADYDLLRGGLMPLGLLAMALTPWAVLRLQARSRDLTSPNNG